MKSLLRYINADSLNESDFTSRSLNLVLGTEKQESLPVVVNEKGWETLENPERLARVFKFKNFSILREFIDQVLRHQEKIGHHSNITISNRDVKIESYTHDIDLVTELDIELTRFIDMLYHDIEYYITNHKNRSI